MSSRDSATARVRRRYQWLAPVYDFGLGERLLYAAARSRAVGLLRLEPGSVVLDVACGTGLNFPLIEQRIGPSGRLVGVDLTSGMLDRARRRVGREGWSNAELVELDASELSSERLEHAGAISPGQRFDAALCTLGLSAIPGWEPAWEAILSLVRTGGRVAVMDGGYPERAGSDEAVKLLHPFAWLICRLAAADCRRRPWLRVARDTDEATIERFTWGYVNVAGGTVRG